MKMRPQRRGRNKVAYFRVDKIANLEIVLVGVVELDLWA
jgi:hypothetical protein